MFRRTNGNIATELPPSGIRGAARLSRAPQSSQSRIDRLRSFAIILSEQVGIDLQSDGRVRVPKTRADRHHVDTGIENQRVEFSRLGKGGAGASLARCIATPTADGVVAIPGDGAHQTSR